MIWPYTSSYLVSPTRPGLSSLSKALGFTVYGVIVLLEYKQLFFKKFFY